MPQIFDVEYKLNADGLQCIHLQPSRATPFSKICVLAQQHLSLERIWQTSMSIQRQLHQSFEAWADDICAARRSALVGRFHLYPSFSAC